MVPVKALIRGETVVTDEALVSKVIAEYYTEIFNDNEPKEKLNF